MALYDSPASKSYQVLTHPSAGRLYAKNGYGQVGNAIAPSHSISATRFTPSAIYNKNVPTGRLSGLRDTQLREAGYGKRYPYPPGLGRVRAYKPGLRAAGWPTLNRTPLRDAYINDNPPPGTLGVRGLSDDTSMMSIDTSSVIVPPDATATDPAPTVYGPASPTADQLTADAAASSSGSGIFSTVTGDVTQAFTSIFGATALTGASAAVTDISKAISGTPSAPRTTFSLPAASSTTTILGMSATTLLLIGGVGLYLYSRK